MNILFNELNILDTTKKAIEALGIEMTTDIQNQAIPILLEGNDLIGQAQTGTGKTFAFAIPILEKIDPSDPSIQALIICPTRELTLQVYKEMIKLVKFNPEIKITSIYGGESYTKQFRALKEKPQIIVATPGRVIDHLERKTLHFSNLKILVLDEADEMLKMGFQEDLERILTDTPSERQTALFSATMPDFIKKVAKKYQKNPVIVQIEKKTLTVAKIEQIYYQVKKSDRNLLLLRLLDYYMPESGIIFANTKKDVDDLAAFLQKNHYIAEGLHGDLKQNQRDYVMNRFRNKNLKLLIATDVAARGLDIPHVDYVFNYELPFEDEIYVHRIGRTGRAGKSGVSISLVYPSVRGKLKMIERFIKTEMKQKEMPTPEMIMEKQSSLTIQQVENLLQKEAPDRNTYILESLLNKGYELSDIASVLLNDLVPKRSYDAIEVPQERNARSERNFDQGRRKDDRQDNRRNNKRDSKRSNDKQSPSMNFKNASINIGNEDGIRAVKLLDYFKKYADLYPKNIGDIVVSEKETTFQIHSASLKRLDALSGKFYNGKKIKTKILK